MGSLFVPVGQEGGGGQAPRARSVTWGVRPGVPAGGGSLLGCRPSGAGPRVKDRRAHLHVREPRSRRRLGRSPAPHPQSHRLSPGPHVRPEAQEQGWDALELRFGGAQTPLLGRPCPVQDVHLDRHFTGIWIK